MVKIIINKIKIEKTDLAMYWPNPQQILIIPNSCHSGGYQLICGLVGKIDISKLSIYISILITWNYEPSWYVLVFHP